MSKSRQYAIVHSMPDQSPAAPKPQVEKFRDLARELEADRAESVSVTPEEWREALRVLYGFDRDRDDAREALGAILGAFGLDAPHDSD